MERRTFLLGLIGSLTALGLVPAVAESANARSPQPPANSDAVEAVEISADDLDGVKIEDAQYYRRRGRRVYRRYYRRPYRRYRRRVRRYYRRGQWYYY
jgi:hypothetical protein